MKKNDDEKGIASLDEVIQEYLDKAAKLQRFKELREEVGGVKPPRQWLCPRCSSDDLTMYVPVWWIGGANQDVWLDDEYVIEGSVDGVDTDYECGDCGSWFRDPDRELRVRSTDDVAADETQSPGQSDRVDTD